MRNVIFIVVFFIVSKTEPLNRINLPLIHKPISMLPTRRILNGRLVGDTRPYMVYLRADNSSMTPRLIESHWLCGGVIINKGHILTSAACIEDVKLFYVIAGTHKVSSTSVSCLVLHTSIIHGNHFLSGGSCACLPPEWYKTCEAVNITAKCCLFSLAIWIPPDVTDNECIKNGAKKAIWKCVPKSHSFDGFNFNNINWMIADIAVVKVEDDFNFERKILGCDFIPQKIELNTRSKSLENSGTIASIAGWGSTKRYINIDMDPPEKAENSVDLLETDVIIIAKKGCKNHWDTRYHNIIDQHMICTKDSTDFNTGNECMENETNCKILDDFDDEYYESKPMLIKRRMIEDPSDYTIHTADHRNYRKNLQLPSGGFCENDHGGPLVVGRGKAALVIGIMSACQTNVRSQKCFGPFLFTSVYKYWNIIDSCSNVEMKSKCRRLMQSSDVKFQEIHSNWIGHPDGLLKPNSPGPAFERNYAPTPLYPILSILNSEFNTSSITPSATNQKLLQHQSNVSSIRANLLRPESLQSEQELKFYTSDTLINVSTSMVTTSDESPILQFSKETASPVSLSSWPSPFQQRSQNPEGEVLNILNTTDKVSATRKTRRDNKYSVFQQWQQRYQDYLRSKTK